jgi:hypothetical protein
VAEYIPQTDIGKSLGHPVIALTSFSVTIVIIHLKFFSLTSWNWKDIFLVHLTQIREFCWKDMQEVRQRRETVFVPTPTGAMFMSPRQETMMAIALAVVMLMRLTIMAAENYLSMCHAKCLTWSILLQYILVTTLKK